MNIIALMIESFVALLLVVTIAYCIVLNRRLKIMRLDETMFRKTIDDLIHATDVAEQSIQTLKQTAEQHEARLKQAIQHSAQLSEKLELQMQVANTHIDDHSIELPDIAHMPLGDDHDIQPQSASLNHSTHSVPGIEVDHYTPQFQSHPDSTILDRAKDAVRRVREKHGLSDERDRKLFDQEFAA